MSEVQHEYDRLDKISKRLLQSLAFQHGDAHYHKLARQANARGLPEPMLSGYRRLPNPTTDGYVAMR